MFKQGSNVVHCGFLLTDDARCTELINLVQYFVKTAFQLNRPFLLRGCVI